MSGREPPTPFSTGKKRPYNFCPRKVIGETGGGRSYKLCVFPIAHGRDGKFLFENFDEKAEGIVTRQGGDLQYIFVGHAEKFRRIFEAEVHDVVDQIFAHVTLENFGKLRVRIVGQTYDLIDPLDKIFGLLDFVHRRIKPQGNFIFVDKFFFDEQAEDEMDHRIGDGCLHGELFRIVDVHDGVENFQRFQLPQKLAHHRGGQLEGYGVLCFAYPFIKFVREHRANPAHVFVRAVYVPMGMRVGNDLDGMRVHRADEKHVAAGNAVVNAAVDDVPRRPRFKNGQLPVEIFVRDRLFRVFLRQFVVRRIQYFQIHASIIKRRLFFVNAFSEKNEKKHKNIRKKQK